MSQAVAENGCRYGGVELVGEDRQLELEVRVSVCSEPVREANEIIDHVEVGGRRLGRVIGREVDRLSTASFVGLLGANPEVDSRHEVAVARCSSLFAFELDVVIPPE